jgi:dipeptidyl aminopeptidase/acylaminoacyl peptidase
MDGSTRRRAPLSIVFVGIVLTSLVPGWNASAQQEPPRIVFTGSDDGVHIRVISADQAGDLVQLSPDAEPFVTINGGLAAFTRHHRRVVFASDVLIEEASTGERIHKVDDARYPLIFDGGTSLVFLPDNNGRDVPEDRDAFVNSVWYRDLVTGEEQKLAQLNDPDRHVVQLAASPDGQQVAFTEGNDSFLFVWNIWVSGIDGTGLARITDDDRSLYPSFGPDGQTIAFTYLNPSRRCSASLHLMDVDGANAHRLIAGTCDAVLLRPIWLDDQTLVVWRWERTDRGFNRPAGLLAVSAETGEVLEEVVDGPVHDFAVAREAGQVVFRMKNGRIGVHDFTTGDTFPVPGGRDFPFGHLHIDGSLELAI